MRFIPTPLKDARIIELDKLADDRGFFARAFCAETFDREGLTSQFIQSNVSFNPTKGTLRGLHYQLPPAQETKMVRCTQGSLFDVIVDLRPHSETFKKSFGVELSAETGKTLVVPEGFAHGYVTLEDNTEALYFVSAPYNPKLERGIRWNDPSFDIQWPIEPTLVSEKDQSHPLFDSSYHLGEDASL